MERPGESPEVRRWKRLAIVLAGTTAGLLVMGALGTTVALREAAMQRDLAMQNEHVALERAQAAEEAAARAREAEAAVRAAESAERPK